MSLTLALALATANAGPPTVAAPQPAMTAPDPARLAIARDIVAVVLPPDQRERMMGGVLDAMMGNMTAGIIQGTDIREDLEENPDLRRVFQDFIARQRDLALSDIKAALPDLVEAYARAYARLFSLEDLTAVRSFVATPAGAHFLQRGPQLLADPDIAQWQRTLTAQGAARQKSEMERFKSELLKVRSAKHDKS